MPFAKMALVLASFAVFSSTQAQEVKGVTDKEIRVGTMGALTGPLAANGISIQAGIASVINSMNDRGGVNGRKIKLISEDNAFSAPLALAAVRKMVSNDGIFALVVPHATTQAGAVIPYMDQQKIPIFAPYGGLKDWYFPPREGLFGLFALGEDQNRVLGRWAAKEGHRKVMALHIDGGPYQKMAQEVENGVHTVAKDGSVELVAVKFATSDYAPVVIRIAQSKPDALVVMLSEFETVLLAKELRNQHLNIQIYSWVPVVTQNLINIGGPAVEGMKAVSLTVAPTDDTPAVKEYRVSLAKYFPSEKPDFYSLYSYAVAKVFTEGLVRMHGTVSVPEFYKALYTMKNFDTGLLAPVTFAADRHQGTSGIFPGQIVNGKWKMGAAIDSTRADW